MVPLHTESAAPTFPLIFLSSVKIVMAAFCKFTYAPSSTHWNFGTSRWAGWGNFSNGVCLSKSRSSTTCWEWPFLSHISGQPPGFWSPGIPWVGSMRQQRTWSQGSVLRRIWFWWTSGFNPQDILAAQGSWLYMFYAFLQMLFICKLYYY